MAAAPQGRRPVGSACLRRPVPARRGIAPSSSFSPTSPPWPGRAVS